MRLNFASTYLDQSSVDRSMPVIVKNNIRHNNTKNINKINNNGLRNYSLTVFVFFLVFSTLGVVSSKELECAEECAPNEHCRNGMCVDSSLLNLVLRSEEISEHNIPIDAPIRIHKYNLDNSESIESNESSPNEEDDYLNNDSNNKDDDDDDNENLIETRKRLVNAIDSLWPTNKLRASRNLRKNDLLFKSSESESNEEGDTEETESNFNYADDDNNSSADSESVEFNSEDDGDNDDDDLVLNRVNKRSTIKELLNNLEDQDNDEDDSEESSSSSESDSDEDSDEDQEQESAEEEQDDDDDQDEENNEKLRIFRRSADSSKSNKEILKDLLYILSDKTSNYRNNDLDNEDVIMNVNVNDDGSYDIEEIQELPTEEKGILEPIVYQRELKDRNGNRYFEEDLVKFDELNQSPVSEELTSASNEVEQLPSDSAYFYTQQQQQQQQLQNEQPDDYFEVPKRSNIYLRVPQEQQYQSDEQQQQQQQLPLDDDNSSVESFEAVQAVVNPFESFLDSIVGSNQEESNQEEKIEKRVFVLPAPLVPEEQIAELPYTRPQLGLIDLITNRANRFESSEYNSPEFGSNEEERNRILQLQPVRTLFWDDELNRDALVPSVGLIDSVNARKYGYGDDSSSTEFERQQRAFILRPNSYWSREEGLQNESEENRSADIPEAEDKNEVFERIKENLDQEQQKFMENLLDDQVLSKNHQQQQQQDQHDQQQQFQMVDDNKELSETLPQVQDNYIEIKLKKKIERHEAEDLLSFISQLTAIDSSLIKDINVDGDRIWFRLDGVESEEDLGLFVQEILNHERQIQQEKGLTIVSSNLISNPNIENIEKRKQAATSQQDANAKKFFLITVTVCGSVLAILITLVAIFVIRRRAYLRNKLIDELNLPKKKKFDDVERLVDADYTEQSRFTKLMGRLCSYKQKNEKNDVESQQDLDATTPNKDTEKILSRQSHQDYQELCRSEEFVPTHLMTTPVTTNTEMTRKSNVAESTRSSTSSCTPPSTSTTPNSNTTTQVIALPVLSEEPINNIDIDVTTGHVILAYMEDHLNEKNRILKEWEDLSKYEADQNKTEIGMKFMTKNRYSNILPYDHNRVKLHDVKEQEDDYINASYITDDDPKNPAYIATQGPLSHTTSEFWQMVWEQNSVMIISLCRTVEYGSSKCHQYWPTNGIQTYGIFEVNLVSEHVWCEDYLVRSFYLKNLSNGLSRTVTQFHFLTWPENDLPQNFKSILDFRRKVNRSYKKKSSPVIVHCNDGVGRTGTFILIDMILNKIIKGAKEIDLAATVEYLRDQRIDMVKSKNQFEFVFAVIADEVQNMLKAQDEP